MSRQTIILICSFIALWCVIYACNNINDVKGAFFVSSDDYRTTTGKILSSNVVYPNREKRGGANYHSYAILYGYEVAGKNYTSHQVNFDPKSGGFNLEFAERYVNKYPVGRTVTVYYKADEPSFAVLEPQNKIAGAIELMGFFVVFILSLLGILHAKKIQKK